jgi:two-component system chemotaxis response regulator CheB
VRIFQSDPEFQVVGVARDGLEAVALTGRLRPDVITMDIRMPRMDGFQATKQIMRQFPTPIVVVSASVEAEDLKIAFNAIRAGALTVVEKPDGPASNSFETIRNQLLTTVKLMAGVKVVRRWATDLLCPTRVPAAGLKTKEAQTALVAIAASTGGPGALYQMLQSLPPDLPVPVLVVQHIAVGFGQGLVDWLAGATKLRVETARHGVLPSAGQVLVAPDNAHLLLGPDGRVRLRPRADERDLCPSADILFASVAEVLGRRALGVIMTGMGHDGVEGLKRLKAAGGRVLAQDESSCVVFGMPKEAIAAGVVDRVVPLDKIAETIVQML